MNALQSLVLPGLRTSSSLSRALPPQGRSPGRDDWQQAFESAAQGDGSTHGGVDEASRLLALGNLATSPAESLEMPSSQARNNAGERLDIRGTVGDTPESAAPLRPEHMDAGAGKIADAVAEPGLDATASCASRGPSPAPAAGDAPPRRSSADAAAVASPSAPMPRSMAARSFASPREASAHQAIASYAAATASASAERTADFSLVSRSSTLPVRIHVQWRGRVADVWIGLHRQAYDQLPDIRAGVADWITSRGGVPGHVVCNGETLARVAPSPSFPGAL